MKTLDEPEEKPKPTKFGGNEELNKISMEQQIEQRKRIGEANAKKYGIKPASVSRVASY